MRTTLTLDTDVAAKLKTESKKNQDKSFKEIVNETLRLGLLARQEMVAAPPFQVRPCQMGLHRGLNYDNVGEMLEQIEGPQHP